MNKNIKIIIILIVIIVIIFILYNIIRNVINKEEEAIIEETPKEIHRLDNANIFYSIEDMINYVISTVCEEDSLAIYKMFENSYIDDNNINEENALSKISAYNDLELCVVKEVWEAGLTEDINSYYIHCKIRTENEETLDDISDEKDEYYIMRIDFYNMTFAIIPKGNSFSEEDKNLICEMPTDEIISNNYNNFNMIYLSEDDIAHKYYSEIVKLILYKPEELYKYLDINYKNEKFSTFELFKEYISKLSDGMENATLVEYNIEFPKENGESEDVRVQFTIKDTKGYTYIIKEKEILNFEITL